MISEATLLNFTPNKNSAMMRFLEQRILEIEGVSLPMFNEGGFLIVTIDASDRAQFCRIEGRIRDVLEEFGARSQPNLQIR